MHPQIHLNYLAILAAMVANFVLGFLWYGPLFGKTWLKEMGLPTDCKPEPGSMTKPLIFMVISSFLMMFVLACTVLVWRPSFWNAGEDGPSAAYGFFAGFFSWLGFILPVLLGQVGWEKRSWKLFFINIGYYFISLQIGGVILASWR
jgi:hypothetical protein